MAINKSNEQLAVLKTYYERIPERIHKMKSILKDKTHPLNMFYGI